MAKIILFSCILILLFDSHALSNSMASINKIEYNNLKENQTSYLNEYFIRLRDFFSTRQARDPKMLEKRIGDMINRFFWDKESTIDNDLGFVGSAGPKKPFYPVELYLRNIVQNFGDMDDVKYEFKILSVGNLKWMVDNEDTIRASLYTIQRVISAPSKKIHNVDTLHISIRVNPLNNSSRIFSIHTHNIEKNNKSYDVAITENEIIKDSRKAFLVFSIEPPSACVTVDNKNYFNANNEKIEVSTGAHKISISAPGYDAVSFDTSIDASIGTPIRKNLIYQNGYLTINTNVGSSSIYVDDKYIGNGKIAELKLKPGTHRLSVSHTGYITHSDVFDITANNVTTCDVTLSEKEWVPSAIKFATYILAYPGATKKAIENLDKTSEGIKNIFKKKIKR